MVAKLAIIKCTDLIICTMFLPVQRPLNFWAGQGDPLENMQEGKTRMFSFRECLFKHPESGDSGCFITCCPSVNHCLLKCTTANLMRNHLKFVELHNGQLFLWVSLNVYCWQLLFTVNDHESLSVYRETATIIYPAALVYSASVVSGNQIGE